MSDRMNEVLAAIDAETAKCICGNDLTTDGVSLDYCSDVCQYRYYADRSGAEPLYLNPVDHGPTDGRRINEEVNDWWARSSGHHPGIHGADAATVRHHAPNTLPLAVDTRGVVDGLQTFHEALASFTINGRRVAQQLADVARAMHTDENEGSLPIRAVARFSLDGTDYERTGTITALGDNRYEFHSPAQEPVPTPAEPEPNETATPAEADDDEGPTHVYWCPEIADPAAPTLGELQAGTLLGILENGQIQYTATPRELEPSLTDEDLRHRALEHRQNRGTGPERRDNRRWRNR